MGTFMTFSLHVHFIVNKFKTFGMALNVLSINNNLGVDIEFRSPLNIVIGFLRPWLYSCIAIVLKQEVQLAIKKHLN